MASKIGPFVSCLTVMVTTWGSPMRASICEDMRRSSVKTTKQLWIAGWFFGILQGSPNFRCGKVFEEFFFPAKKIKVWNCSAPFWEWVKSIKTHQKRKLWKVVQAIFHHISPLIPHIDTIYHHIYMCLFGISPFFYPGTLATSRHPIHPTYAPHLVDLARRHGQCQNSYWKWP